MMVASDDLDAVVIQIVVGAEAGDGDGRRAAAAVRVVGEFASRAVVEQVVVRIFGFFAGHELVGGERPAFQRGEDVVIELQQVAFAEAEVGDGVGLAVQGAREDEVIRALAAGQGIGTTAAFYLVVARATVDGVVAVEAEEVVGGAVAP